MNMNVCGTVCIYQKELEAILASVRTYVHTEDIQAYLKSILAPYISPFYLLVTLSPM